MQYRDNKWGIPEEAVAWVLPGLITTAVALAVAFGIPALTRLGSVHPASSDDSLQQAWNAISADSFSTPQTTPYDTDSRLRALYQEGFLSGITNGLSAKRNGTWHTGDTLPSDSIEAQAFDSGWRRGAIAILEREAELLTALDQKEEK